MSRSPFLLSEYMSFIQAKVPDWETRLWFNGNLIDTLDMDNIKDWSRDDDLGTGFTRMSIFIRKNDLYEEESIEDEPDVQKIISSALGLDLYIVPHDETCEIT